MISPSETMHPTRFTTKNRKYNMGPRKKKVSELFIAHMALDMVQRWFIPVAEDSLLLPVAHKKDAPIQKVVSQQLQQKGPDLEEVMYHILCWDPKWLMVSHKCIHIIRIRLKYGHSTLLLYHSLLILSGCLQYTYVLLKVLLQLEVIQLS